MTKLLLKLDDKDPYIGLLYRDDNNKTIANIKLSKSKRTLIVTINEFVIITEDINMNLFEKMKDYIAVKIGKIMDRVIAYEKDTLQRPAISLDDINMTRFTDNIYLSFNDSASIIKYGRELSSIIK